jgi:hypothetical protein
MTNSYTLAWERRCIISCLTTRDNQWSSITKHHQRQKKSKQGACMGKIKLPVLWDVEGMVHS